MIADELLSYKITLIDIAFVLYLESFVDVNVDVSIYVRYEIYHDHG